MKKFIHKIHYSQDLKIHHLLFKLLLSIGSIFYGIAINLRNFLYFIRILPKTKLDRIVVSIGNLTTGGTGKTPITAELARMLAKSGKKIAILSRGYGGSLDSKKVNLISDGKKVFYTAKEAGDEPYWMASNVKNVFVLTCKDRIKAAKWAIKEFDIDIFILDDGYQYIKLKRDLNILLIDGHKKFGNNMLLPAGPLREPISEIKRADKIIVVNKISYSQKSIKDCRAYARHLIKKYDKEVFGCGTVANGIYNINQNIPIFESQKVYAFTGIAQPEFFFSAIESHKHKLVKKVEFDDHHDYTDEDLANIITEAKISGANIIVTTEKDIVKIKPLIGKMKMDIPIYVLKLSIELDIANLLKGVIDY